MKFLILLLIIGFLLSGCVDNPKEEFQFKPIPADAKWASIDATPEQDIRFQSRDYCDKSLFIEDTSQGFIRDVLKAEKYCNERPIENKDGSWEVIEYCYNKYRTINIEYYFSKDGTPVSYHPEFIVYFISDENKQVIIYDFPKDFDFTPIEYTMQGIEFECDEK